MLLDLVAFSHPLVYSNLLSNPLGNMHQIRGTRFGVGQYHCRFHLSLAPEIQKAIYPLHPQDLTWQVWEVSRVNVSSLHLATEILRFPTAQHLGSRLVCQVTPRQPQLHSANGHGSPSSKKLTIEKIQHLDMIFMNWSYPKFIGLELFNHNMRFEHIPQNL